MYHEMIARLRFPVIGSTLALGFAVLALSGCAQDVLPAICHSPDFDCYTKQAVKGIIVVRENIDYWSSVHLFGQVLIGLSGLIATVMIALQGDNNKYWTRPIGLVATALVTTLTSALISFHVPDNVDKLIDILGKMVTTVNDFDYKSAKLKDGRDDKRIEEVFRFDLKFRADAIVLTNQFSNDFNKLKLEMLKVGGTAAKLSSIPSPPSDPPQRSQNVAEQGLPNGGSPQQVGHR